MQRSLVMGEIRAYFDIKSPHAYLAVAPTAQLADDYICSIDWLPLELSYKDLGVTSSDADVVDGIRRPPSVAGDRRARMYYATAREYARLQGLKIRGPERLLDSRLANMTLLYAREQGVAMQYLQGMYDAGWPNGWRDVDMTDVAVLARALERAGGHASGLEEYLRSERAQSSYRAAQDMAKASGATGVPHYEILHDGRTKGLFGREHLSLIRHWLHDLGLQRRLDVQPDVSHAWVPKL